MNIKLIEIVINQEIFFSDKTKYTLLNMKYSIILENIISKKKKIKNLYVFLTAYIFFNLKKLNKNKKIKTNFNERSSEKNRVKTFNKTKDKKNDTNDKLK